MIQVTTLVSSQSIKDGFFVRPTRITREWINKPVYDGDDTVTFYIESAGQYSVEFASNELWRTSQSFEYDSLMLFINPPMHQSPSHSSIVIQHDTTETSIDLGPDESYVFTAEKVYDWGRDQVFKVHDNTKVHFEQDAYVRARIVQTEKKVNNVTIEGYGVLDAHYDIEPDVVGIGDDATHQTITIYGKNIRVHGLTIINTNPTCGAWGYCLNINANWSPLAEQGDPFDATELQNNDPPFKYRRAHCQENNMDDSPNTDFSNCPTSHADGQSVTYVKCMTWQMGQDGINAGKFGSVENSFVRVIDDAIKPWDSHGRYTNITIWQQTLGWPINFGWWNWNQPDENTVVEDIYVIHNHNWWSSGGWPETKSGQCVIGGVYGSGAVKSGYTLKNIFVETAASCAVGLEISKQAYSRHPTVDGCVGSIKDFVIDGLFFDEPFLEGDGYDNFLKGAASGGAAACTGDLSGRVDGLTISSSVAGQKLDREDFVIEDEASVPGLTFGEAVDPHPVVGYAKWAGRNAWAGMGAEAEIDAGDGVAVAGVAQCLERCHNDWSCDCAVFKQSEGLCWKRRGCGEKASMDDDVEYDVYVRPWKGV
jgi:hypothetical protein